MCPSRLRVECRAPRAERGGRGRPCPDSPHHGTGHQTASRVLTLPFPPTPTQVEGEQLSPEPMLVKVSAQHRTNISGEPEGIQHWKQIEKGGVAGVTEPGFDGDGIVWVAPIGPWGVIQDDDAGEVTVDHREVFDVAAQFQSAVLSVVSPLENTPAVVQFICHSRAINLHACCEHHQLIPLTHHFQEEIHMGPLMYKKPDGMFVYYHLEDEVRGRSGPDCGP